MALSSCATTNLQSFGTGQNKIALEDDENRIWKRTEEEKERLDLSGHLYKDEALEEYTNNVLNKIVHIEIKGCGLKVKTKIIQEPHLNAFCFPDGTIYIHTGILARMDNEAQLAALLGHEITHAINRHTIKFFRDIKNKTAFYNTFSVTTAGLGVGVVNILGTYGTLAAIYGYSRDNEREADENGFKMMLTAGYDVSEALKIFKHLQENFDKEKKDEPFFFGTHPRLQERIDNYESLIKETISDKAYFQDRKAVNEKEFIEITHELVLNNALLDISLGRFGTAKVGVRKYLEHEPNSAKGYYYLAEIYMHQFEQPENKKLKDKETKEQKKEKAIEFYHKAIELDQAFPLPYKALGIIYFKDSKKEQAKEKLSKYLELNPDADDKLYVENYLKKLEL